MKEIRKASMEDLDQVAQVEAVCFPASEAAGRESFRDRLTVFADHFWVMEEDGRIIGFINGMVTDRDTIEDEMFADASRHREGGAWQSVFGLDVLPEYRCQGLAARLMEALIASAREQGRRGCILTCKERLIPYYEKFGYTLLGVSESVHGGAVWYDMKLVFPGQ